MQPFKFRLWVMIGNGVLALCSLFAGMTKSAEVSDPAAVSYRVAAPESQTIMAYGSGTAIAPHIVLTNSHVVGHGKVGRNVRVKGRGGDWIDGSVLATYQALDMAVIHVPGRELDYVAIADREASPGESVTLCGFGGSGSLSVRRCSVSDNGVAMVDGFPVVRLATYSEGGDSGGGVFNSKGQLVCVLWGGDGQHAATVSTQHFLQWMPQIEQACGPMGCSPPGGAGYRMVYPNPNPPLQSPPAYQPPKTAPLRPIINGNFDKLESQIAALTDAVKKSNEIKSMPGPPGPAGPPGPQGPPGSDAACKCDGCKCKPVSEQPMTVQILDENGAVKSETKAYLGGKPLRLQLVPVKR